jgi:Ca2+-transporting ATPase
MPHPVKQKRNELSKWHQLEVEDVLQRLGSDASYGLTAAEVARRLKEWGYNELNNQGIKGSWRILWEQLTDTLVLILLISAVISGFLGDYKDATGILAIVLLIALLGFSQEYRAEKAIVALKKLSSPTAKVRRCGSVQEMSARYLVPGDIIFLEAGDLVPADCRLLQCLGLRVQEAALTGESQPVNKDPEALSGADLMLGERHNTLYMGTAVTYGRGEAVVAATGLGTELGKISAMVRAVEVEPTPLQKRLHQLVRVLAIASIALVALILVLGLLRGENVQLMFLTAITLVVAALPEGLPAVVTIALALGAQKMLKRRALIRKLPAVEALGSVTAICSGKTGTLTENRLTVTILDVAGHRLDLTAGLRGYCPLPGMAEGQPLLLSQPPALSLLLAGGTLCSDAQLEPSPDEPRCFQAVGDPAEGAVVMAAAREGLWKAELEQSLPRLAQVPFDNRRQRMTTAHRFPNPHALPVALETVWHWSRAVGGLDYITFTKGKVGSLLEVSSQVWVDGGAKKLDGNWQKRISASYHQLAQKGLRVVGVAFRLLPAYPSGGWEDWERDLTFIGLVGMTDPARPEARAAIETCKAAGIRPIMITGDHPLTAWHLARELDIAIDHHLLTGEELKHLSDEELASAVATVSVYARVSPQDKFRIVQALQKQGHLVAMTGDGINDAPALKAADIGVAMGIGGTDVAKEAADMVLLDDNFATIVAAVKEGRVIYDNIRKFIKYLLSSNVGELWVMLLAPFLGMPLPLLPLQILWINLTTDGLPALALGVEPAERGIMSRPPYPPNENIFARGMGCFILWIGLLMGLVSLATGYWYWRAGNLGWQTMLFTVLTLSQMGNALAIRSERDSLFRLGLFSNKPLLGSVILTLGLQLAVIYVPFLQELFTTTALGVGDLAVSLALSALVFWAVELEKWLIRLLIQSSF